MINLGTKVYGGTVKGIKKVEGSLLSAEKVDNRVIVANTNIQPSKRQHIDISWLSAASESYNISADIKDYIIVPVPIVTSDLPNRNMQAFPLGEITYFDPMHGRFIYQTFTGKPAHVDHKNDDPLQAKGVILDAHFDYVSKYGIGKIIALSAYDRTKDPKLCRSIINGDRDSYSMGAFVTTFVCSVCGTPYGTDGQIACPHQLNPQAPKIEVINGALNYMNCRGVTFFELSNVGSPADVTAFTGTEELLSVSI